MWKKKKGRRAEKQTGIDTGTRTHRRQSRPAKNGQAGRAERAPTGAQRGLRTYPPNTTTAAPRERRRRRERGWSRSLRESQPTDRPTHPTGPTAPRPRGRKGDPPGVFKPPRRNATARYPDRSGADTRGQKAGHRDGRTPAMRHPHPQHASGVGAGRGRARPDHRPPRDGSETRRRRTAPRGQTRKSRTGKRRDAPRQPPTVARAVGRLGAGEDGEEKGVGKSEAVPDGPRPTTPPILPAPPTTVPDARSTRAHATVTNPGRAPPGGKTHKTKRSAASPSLSR